MILPQETNVCNSQQETIVRRIDPSAIKFISGLVKIYFRKGRLYSNAMD